ncbi:MAG: MFS transporter, partial [Candidatus Schmidhempelia sp.]|nr:MFS transporter [Candidatus Schmidhempelia sp.]
MNVFLKNKYFRTFSIAEILSGAGDSLFYLALITYASKLNNYSLALSLIAISEALPKVFNSIAGYYADKTKNKFKYIILLSLFRFVLYSVIGILFAKNIASWNLVIIAIIVNLVSDSMGAYSNGLQMPLIVKDEIGEATGFNGGISEIITMLAQFMGAGLLLVMSYSGLAWINAVTFLLAGILFLTVKVQYTGANKQLPEQEINEQGFFKTFATSLKQIKKSKGLLTITIILALLNGIIGTVEPILSIVVASARNSMIILSYSFTIALVGAAESCGIILGSILGPQIFKKVSIFRITLLSAITSVATVIAILTKNIFLSLIVLLFLGIFIGTISPKMMQWLVSTVD